MDVKCERCNTEYEFDDALVSGRGTTVKCTNCGHKFKIRLRDGDFSEDFWNVTTGDGRTLVFTSLRELQRAIQGYLVERNDRLSRGGLPPKAIGQIPELAPFFEQREAAKKSANQGGRTNRTQDGLGPAAQALVVGHNEARPRQPTKPEFPAPPANEDSVVERAKSTLIGTGPLSEQEAFPISSSEGAPSQRHAISVPPPATVREPEPSFEPMPLAAAPALAPSAPPATRVPTPPPPAPKAAPPVSPIRDTVPLKRPTPTPPPMPVATRAAPGVSNPPPAVSSPPPLPERARRPSETAPIAARSSGSTPAPSDPPARAHASSRPSADERERDRERDRNDTRSDAPAPVAAKSANGSADVSSPLPPRRVRSLLSEIEEERDRRGVPPSLPDGPPLRRRSVGGFIIAAVVVGGLLMLGAVWAKNNLGITLGTKPPVTTPAVDPRVASFLANGEKALADGNLELAKESFDKASALSERDAHVLLGLARLAAVRADVLWLKSRLLPADAADDQRITRDSLNELSAGARRAAEDALIVAPDDPAALRAKIDALRISGDRDGARALVGRIASSGSQPESAYVLAALDLAEAEPLWPTVIERLKAASSAETGPGRARATLVYALSRSGDAVGAKAEVDRLTAMPRAHTLLPLLRGFVDKAKAKTDAGAPLAALEADAGPPAKNGKPAVSGASGVGGGGGLSNDARDLVTQGEKARSKGDYDKAKTLFTAAVDKNPNDSEALAGLGAIAYAQRDMNGARAAYKRVLAINPNYMPALVGLADVEWDSGDKAAATKMYKDIVDRYPEGAYPGRIKPRAEGGG